MTIFVFINSFGLYIVSCFLFFMATVKQTPLHWQIGYCGAMFGINFFSLLQILVFQPETIREVAMLNSNSQQAQVLQISNFVIPTDQDGHTRLTQGSSSGSSNGSSHSIE